MLTPADIERFWEKVDRTPGHGPQGDCWIWTASKFFRKRYGQFWLGNTVRQAHRVSYVIAHGSIDPALMICHRCDNPSCVRPEHLFPGTGSDNMQDAASKGRLSPPRLVGELNPRASLTAGEVLNIRELHRSGVRRCEIARRFCVTEGAVRSVVKRLTWAHVQ